MTEAHRRLDSLHHVACAVRSVPDAVQWYQSRFHCEVAYEDETWALLRFSNSDLALVKGGDHPPHIGLVSAAALEAGPMTTHRDGTRSVYITDPSGNAVELLDPASVRTF
jgi:catechol 2,3-dioxygenase-like lactoylglutathione lyase family enzyme